MRASARMRTQPSLSAMLPSVSDTMTSARSGRSMSKDMPCIGKNRAPNPAAVICSAAVTSTESLKSIPYTRAAPAFSAQRARTPVPVPRSTTIEPGLTTSWIAAWNAAIRTRSPSSRVWKSVPQSVISSDAGSHGSCGRLAIDGGVSMTAPIRPTRAPAAGPTLDRLNGDR